MYSVVNSSCSQQFYFLHRGSALCQVCHTWGQVMTRCGYYNELISCWLHRVMLLFTCKKLSLWGSAAAKNNNSSTENTSAAVVGWHSLILTYCQSYLWSLVMHCIATRMFLLELKFCWWQVYRIFASLIMIEIPKKLIIANVITVTLATLNSCILSSCRVKVIVIILILWYIWLWLTSAFDRWVWASY